MNSSPAPVDPPLALRVDVARQILEVTGGNQPPRQFKISTSKFGLGTEEGSHKTPLGRFVISEKIGHGEPHGMVFKSRIPTGTISPLGGEEDLILTRILRLQGLDPDNQNSWDRYIYIHGTNQEDQLGTPASHGCIRMRNLDVAELFDLIPEGTSLEITA